MSATLHTVLIVLSPFIMGAAVLAGFKAIDVYTKWQYRRAVEKRNAKLFRHGLTPFRGTRSLYDDQH